MIGTANHSRAATRGNWNEVWDSFDRRQQAKAANDGGAGEAAKADEDDMFTRAGVAAE